MRQIACLLALLIFATAACGSGDDGAEAPADSPAVLAAAVEELITVDHTFGSGPPPFSTYLILDTTDPSAGTGMSSDDAAVRALTEDERAAVEAVVSTYGTLQWIADADDFRTEDLRPTVDGAVIIGMGEPTFRDDGALVPVSLWCGGLCGTWLTYELAKVDGSWAVVGIDGPVAVS